MSLRQALPAALEAKNHRECEYGGLCIPIHALPDYCDDTDRVQRDLVLVDRSLRNGNTCVKVLN